MTKNLKTGTSKMKSILPEAIQQREQLKNMIVQKLYKDYGRSNSNNHNMIEEIVKRYFQNQKITDQSLRALRNEVASTLKSSKQYSSISANRSLMENSFALNTHQNSYEQNPKQEKVSKHQTLPPIVNQSSSVSKKSKQVNKQQDDISDVSSVAGKSVYYIDGNGEDQWASLVKFDSELYKRQLELHRLRQQQFKKKTKLQLDQQILEKKQKKQKQKRQAQAYNDLQKQSYQNFKRQEEAKRIDKQRRLQLQKQMRNMQIKEVKKRKKEQVNRQNEFDRQLVQKIQQQLQFEKHQLLLRKEKQRQRLQKIQEEGEINNIKKKQQKKQQRQQEIRQQNQYTQLQNKLEEQRQMQKKEREDKIKQLMISFANTVGKERKAHLASEDQKMMTHIKKQLLKKQKEQIQKKKKQQQDRQELKQFFDKQIEQKKQRKQQENYINTLQADIWKQDNQNFKAHEQKRQEYINQIKRRHNQVLQAQIQEKQRKKDKKMNTLELLYNKSLIKDLGKENEYVKKSVVPI